MYAEELVSRCGSAHDVSVVVCNFSLNHEASPSTTDMNRMSGGEDLPVHIPSFNKSALATES